MRTEKEIRRKISTMKSECTVGCECDCTVYKNALHWVLEE